MTNPRLLRLEQYRTQADEWPARGRHILAHFDHESIIVYQAYSPAIGQFAAANGYFGGDFSYSRMSWIKPGFLWMMYRSGWGTKEGQQVVLAIRLRREFFDTLLANAVPSSFDSDLYATRGEWNAAVTRSHVRLQWDPDHGPTGNPRERRAIQLGLRGPALEEYGRRAILDIEDISPFVAEQRAVLQSEGRDALQTPWETVYRPTDPTIAARLRLEP